MNQQQKREVIKSLQEERTALAVKMSEIDTIISHLGGSAAPAASGKKVTSIKKGGGRKGTRPEAAIQAAADARAVKAGTATPEQQERYVARQAAKAAKSAPVSKGASLAEVASTLARSG